MAVVSTVIVWGLAATQVWRSRSLSRKFLAKALAMVDTRLLHGENEALDPTMGRIVCKQGNL